VTVRTRPKQAALLLLLLAVALQLGGCNPPAADPARHNAVRALLGADPQSLSVIGTGDRYAQLVGMLISDPLVGYDADLRLRGRLAESWRVSEDGREVTFRLRRGVRWHDGQPVTARDVLFTVDKIRDPASRARTYAAGFDEHEVEVVAPDDYTVVARYREPYADFLEYWWVPIIPAHAVGGGELLTSDFARHPIGCGPFRFVEFVPGERLVLEANDDYWDGRPSIDTLTFRMFPDERTAYQTFLRGELDLMPATPDIFAEAATDERPWPIERAVYYRFNVWYLGWNLREPDTPFADPAVRRALVTGMDRARFAATLRGGLARPAVTSWHPESPWADPGLAPLPYAPDEARAMLARAGWIDADGDGVRERDGRRLSFGLLTRASSQQIVDQMAQWVQQSLREIGAEVRIDKLEGQAFMEAVRAGRFEAMMHGISLTPIPDQYELYHSSAREGGFNYGGFDDPEVDRLLESGRRTFDEDARLEIYHRLQRRIHELQPISPLFNFASPLIHDARLRGIEPSPVDHWRITPGPRAWHWAEGPARD